MRFEEYVDDVNRSYARDATHPAATWTPGQIVAVGFNDNDVRHIPCARGAFYMANLDSQIRNNSEGRRNLDDFLKELFVARERGEFRTVEDW